MAELDEARAKGAKRMARSTPSIASMGDGMKANMEGRKRIAEKQARDASR
jgi:hypothetical protein